MPSALLTHQERQNPAQGEPGQCSNHISNVKVMTKEQYVQAGELANELNAIRAMATDLRTDINQQCARHHRVESAGIRSNLIALVDVWEHQHVSQIEEQFNAL